MNVYIYTWICHQHVTTILRLWDVCWQSRGMQQVKDDQQPFGPLGATDVPNLMLFSSPCYL